MRRRNSGVLGFLTSALVAATAFVGIYVLVVLADPQTIINPFPPPTMPAVAVLATPTSVFSRQTEITVQTQSPSVGTHTPEPYSTQFTTEAEAQLVTTVEPTELPALATATIVVTVEPTSTTSSYAYILQAGSIGYTTQFTHPDQGCDWLGVAGTVYDADGGPAIELIAHVEGTSGFWMDAITGSRLEYGEAGYEITLGDTPYDSDAEFSIQLLNTFGEPLSEQVAIQTFSGCDKNLILVNFVNTD